MAAAEAGERLVVVAKRALWNGTGSVQTRTKHERASRASPVWGLLGLG